MPEGHGVVDRPDRGRFELPVGDAVAVAHYRLDGDRVVLTHTEVPRSLSGKGIGSRLARGVFGLPRDEATAALAAADEFVQLPGGERVGFLTGRAA